MSIPPPVLSAEGVLAVLLCPALSTSQEVVRSSVDARAKAAMIDLFMSVCSCKNRESEVEMQAKWLIFCYFWGMYRRMVVFYRRIFSRTDVFSCLLGRKRAKIAGFCAKHGGPS